MDSFEPTLLISFLVYRKSIVKMRIILELYTRESQYMSEWRKNIIIVKNNLCVYLISPNKWRELVFALFHGDSFILQKPARNLPYDWKRWTRRWGAAVKFHENYKLSLDFFATRFQKLMAWIMWRENTIAAGWSLTGLFRIFEYLFGKSFVRKARIECWRIKANTSIARFRSVG